jgi:beta-glucosidase
VNGTHVAEHDDLLEGLLRREWGWKGAVISDW